MVRQRRMNIMLTLKRRKRKPLTNDWRNVVLKIWKTWTIICGGVDFSNCNCRQYTCRLMSFGMETEIYDQRKNTVNVECNLLFEAYFRRIIHTTLLSPFAKFFWKCKSSLYLFLNGRLHQLYIKLLHSYHKIIKFIF